MKKISAYGKLLQIPGIGAFGIVPIIAPLTVGIYNVYYLIIVLVIGGV